MSLKIFVRFIRMSGFFMFVTTVNQPFEDTTSLKRIRKETDCSCELQKWPVCGRNLQTYDNICYLNCAGVELDHEGACNSRRKRSFFEYEDCNCPKIFLPVCGGDDVTYPSQCVRRCAGVDLKNFGECKDAEK